MRISLPGGDPTDWSEVPPSGVPEVGLDPEKVDNLHDVLDTLAETGIDVATLPNEIFTLEVTRKPQTQSKEQAA